MASIIQFFTAGSIIKFCYVATFCTGPLNTSWLILSSLHIFQIKYPWVCYCQKRNALFVDFLYLIVSSVVSLWGVSKEGFLVVAAVSCVYIVLQGYRIRSVDPA